MTCVAYDGRTLAADKLATSSGLKRTVTKLRKIRGHLCAVAGDFDLAQEMFAWFERGADPADLPAFQKTQDWVGLLVITPDRKILKFERSAYPMDFTESGVYALGSGRDFALAAMHLGKTAAQAVEVASWFDVASGNGVDILTLD